SVHLNGQPLQAGDGARILGESALTLDQGQDAELILAHKKLATVHENGNSREVDIGYVGEVEKINVDILNDLLDQDYIPVIAPIGVGVGRESYNINADYVAAEVAGALQAEKLILLTDIEGIYRDYKDKSTFISTLKQAEAKEMISQGAIAGGMIPKVEACLRALEAGAGKTHIIDGRLDHSLILEVFTSQGIGSEVVK
ncbi:MAG: acetylglutamate kinase, partial [Selenomonadaceae bacterium]